MKTFENIEKKYEELEKAKSYSHAFYIGQEIVFFDCFFPNKRIPLIVGMDSPTLKTKIVEKLIGAYGEQKEICVFTEKNKQTLLLKDLENCSIYPMEIMFSKETLTESKRYDFADLVEIMAILRGEGGCDWDRAQTHDSIRINLIEEAYELVEGIDKDDSNMMLEETGDVLLQSIFHTQIEKEKGGFDYSDMLTTLCDKLVTRHTHIFGDNHATNKDEALNFWQEAKKKEKGYKNYSHAIDLIPKNLPALLYAYKVQKTAKKAGFDWDDIKYPIDKIQEELDEVLSASESEKCLEGGDLLFAVVNVLRFLKIDPEIALRDASKKFVKRFELVEKELTKDGKEMNEFSLEEMDAVWNSIKHTID